MAEQNTEIITLGIIRHSNEEAKRITRECIEIALIKLLDKKDYESISITEIVKKAGVSRTAFYSHYASKEDVLKSTLSQTINRIIALISPDDPREPSFWNHIFAEIDKIKDEIRLILRCGLGTHLLLELNAAVTKSGQEDEQAKYTDLFLVGAIFNVLIAWIMDNDQKSASEMAEICVEIVNHS